MRSFFPSLFLIFLLAGCASSPKPTYYTLTASPVPTGMASKDIRVMVGPIALPDLLDQPRLVVQTDGNEVKIEEYHRWAGSLKNDIGRVVGANLARETGISNIWAFSQSTQGNFDYQVLIDVQTLESRQEGSVLLDMLWTVRPKDSERETIMGRSISREEIMGSSIDAIVAAQSRAFASASSEIAKAIRSY